MRAWCTRPKPIHAPWRLMIGSGHRRRTRRVAPADGIRRARRRRLMGRKILLVTSDQQRYDTLGCNGGIAARTPVIDSLAAEGFRYERAHPQSVVCMPSRSTIITGQHPEHARCVDERCRPTGRRPVRRGGAARRTATAPRSIGKPHFEPFLDPFARFIENRFAREDLVGLAPRLRTLRDGDPWRPRATALRPVDGRQPSRGDLDVLPSARRGIGGQCRRRWRHRGAAGARQRGSTRVVPHRLGRRSHDLVARLALGRRRLVLLDELPRSASSVGPAGIGARPDQLARRAPSRWLHRGSRPDARTGARRQAPALEVVVRRQPGVELRGARQVGSRHHDRRPGSRGQRPQRHRVRVDRRSPREGADGNQGSRLGRRCRCRLHDGSRRTAGRFRFAVQGSVSRRRVDEDSIDLAAGAFGQRCSGNGFAARRPGRPRPDVLSDCRHPRP